MVEQHRTIIGKVDLEQETDRFSTGDDGSLEVTPKTIGIRIVATGSGQDDDAHSDTGGFGAGMSAQESMRTAIPGYLQGDDSGGFCANQL